MDFELKTASVNMAIDEAVSIAVGRGESPPTIRFYGWEPSAVSIGCFQSVEEEVDVEVCKEIGVDIVRRRTGAGSVYHDRDGEITYSVICPLEMVDDDISASYRTICGWIIDALDLLGLQGQFHPINDVLVSGRKISGSAQTRRGGVFLMHGTLLYDLDPGTMFSVLKVGKEKLSDKDIVEFDERVTCILNEIEVPWHLVLRALRVAFTSEKDWEMGALSKKEMVQVHRLVVERYGSDEWTYSR
ncbi:MAG: lipoate--protein ligase family protein [Methanomassiliicoccales archaeon]|nr:lipoate--protein ligase family protein [Methanomassiliicoccales archaeon]